MAVKLDMRLGDCLDVLPQLAAGSVHCCVTSPPYWGLRDYGTATWEGVDAGCDHRRVGPADDSAATPRDGLRDGFRHGKGDTDHANEPYRETCGKCGAHRIDSQLGLEATPEEYVDKIVEVFRAVRRVLRDDGTLWLNMGDRSTTSASKATRNGLKTKNLFGMPWRTAFALQADGWYLRSDIIWHKPNPMPESCTDRPTKSHEYLFLLTKSAKYFYDADAIREPAAFPDGPNAPDKIKSPHGQGFTRRAKTRPIGQRNASDHNGQAGRMVTDTGSRNKRSVWTIATQPYAKAHFATFPEALVLPCILAGTSEEGCCVECGAPWERVVDKPKPPPEVMTAKTTPTDGYVNTFGTAGKTEYTSGQKLQIWLNANPATTTGWQPTCTCDADTVPCTVLDPFLGSGTTAKVAQQYGRSFVGCELSAEYLELARDRFNQPRLFS